MPAIEETHDTATELDALREALTAAETSPKAAARAPKGFDPACLFLLDLRWDNLFERVDRDGMTWRCKGCGEELRFSRREGHQRAHRRAVAKQAARPYRDTAIKVARAVRAERKGGDVSKTQLARETAVAVVTAAGRPMKTDEIVAAVLTDSKVQEAGVSKGTVATQISREMSEPQPRLTRVEKGVYEAVAAGKSKKPKKKEETPA